MNYPNNHETNHSILTFVPDLFLCTELRQEHVDGYDTKSFESFESFLHKVRVVPVSADGIAEKVESRQHESFRSLDVLRVAGERLCPVAVSGQTDSP